jgi:hypothetical protein
MKHLIIAAVVLWILFHFAGIFWSSKDYLPDGTLAKFLEAPRRSIVNPYHNGYFYLFGLTAAAPLDPAKTGYEIWVEESSESRRAGPNENRSSRSDLTLAVSPELTAPVWDTDEPLSHFRKEDAAVQAATGKHRILLTRYEHWLEMPFEDWGFGHRVIPLHQDIMTTHRLYVVEGFSLGTQPGLDRLSKELQFWRTVLREAKTIGTKVLAQVVITDDIQLLSRILARPTVDKTILTIGLQMTLPLSESEYSLRWPVRNQLALAVKENRAGDSQGNGRETAHSPEDEWLLSAAALPRYAFGSIEHPAPRSMLGITLQSAQSSNTYAAYYEAIINASESRTRMLPHMREVTGSIQRGIIESLVDPHPLEPDWEIFHRQLMETDTRLRLASLQIQLRRPSAQTAVPVRLAEVGSQYFDPFTGLPMLWSPTQQKLYSVGKDRLDDGGDPTFDISVPAIVANAQTVAKDTVPATTGRRAERR